MNQIDHLHRARERWDRAAVEFDREPDHGLWHAAVRNAWMNLLKEWLPAERSRVLDAGCGTGSLSLLMAEMGHEVTGIDVSEAMISKATIKAAGTESRARFAVMNAEAPSLVAGSFDVVVGRHVLWAFQKPSSTLASWAECLRPRGRMILIEGFWTTGVGMHIEQVVAALPAGARVTEVKRLETAQALWGGPVRDERFMVVADLA